LLEDSTGDGIAVDPALPAGGREQAPTKERRQYGGDQKESKNPEHAISLVMVLKKP
jgi:hypothetical protein